MTRDDAYDFMDRTFRPIGEWHHGDIYLFLYTLPDFINFFQAPNPEEEGLVGSRDETGAAISAKFLAVLETGGGFVEYEIHGVSGTKIAFALPATVANTSMFIASGFWVN